MVNNGGHVAATFATVGSKIGGIGRVVERGMLSRTIINQPIPPGFNMGLESPKTQALRFAISVSKVTNQ